MNNPPEILLFLGRLHPLLVHLPIAFIVLLAALELLSRSPRFRHANANAGLILAFSVPACIFTVVCGWLLSLGGGYQDQLLSWHKWTGIVTAFACLMAGLLYSLNYRTAYRVALTSGVAVLLVTSHFGGSLTHGSDYLVRYAPAPVRTLFGYRAATAADSKAAKAEDKALFASVVQPILNQNCVGCHGAEKAKAGLRLDSFEALLKGGENGPVIIPGKPAESTVLKRLQLPTSSDDHMPPEGKPQPQVADIALLEWWIGAGAPTNKTAAELKPPPSITRILESRTRTTLPTSKRLAAKPMQELQPLLEQITKKIDVPIGQIAPKEPWLQCTASLLGTNFGDAELSALASVAPNLKWLDLGGTAVTDAGLGQIKAMGNLTRLHLERTSISDAGIANLSDLADLEYLNLYGTAITDAGLNSVQSLPKLKQIYLWQTKVSPEAAKSFTEARLDKAQLEEWEREIEELRTKVREAKSFVIDTGTPVAPAGTNAAAVNTVCPVSGKAVDASITVAHEGKLVAFCCNDCKAKFQQDPKTYLAKLEVVMPKPDKSETTK